MRISLSHDGCSLKEGERAPSQRPGFRPFQLQAGRSSFTLVEVVFALGVFSFALIAIIGLFLVGISTNKESSDQIHAADLASLLISTRRALPTSTTVNLALPPLDTPYPAIGTYLTNTSGVAVDGTLSGTRSYNLYYQAGTNAVTGEHLAKVYLMLWWPITAPMPTNNPSACYELTTQIELP